MIRFHLNSGFGGVGGTVVVVDKDGLHEEVVGEMGWDGFVGAGANHSHE